MLPVVLSGEVKFPLKSRDTSNMRSSYRLVDMPVQPTVWRLHMSTCDHHDNACTVWFVMTIIYLMSCSTCWLFRQVSSPSAKWWVLRLPATPPHFFASVFTDRCAVAGRVYCSRLRFAALKGIPDTLFHQPTWSRATIFIFDLSTPNLIKIHCVVVEMEHAERHTNDSPITLSLYTIKGQFVQH
jgi:hypothetical protein